MKYALTIPALLTPTLALAHAGDHGGEGLGSLATHALSEPDHALVLFAVLAVPVAVWFFARRRG